MLTQINPNDWKVNLECPNCGRDVSRSNIPRREGCRYYFKVTIPAYCIWCEQEKENKEGNQK